MRRYEIESGTGKHKVVLFALVTENGIMANLVGGEKPHLGGVVVSIPRPSLSQPGMTSCTTSVLPLINHKDDRAAKPLAEMLARETAMAVSVAAGLHINEADAIDIERLLDNCLKCGRELLDRMKGSI